MYVDVVININQYKYIYIHIDCNSIFIIYQLYVISMNISMFNVYQC